MPALCLAGRTGLGAKSICGGANAPIILEQLPNPELANQFANCRKREPSADFVLDKDALSQSLANVAPPLGCRGVWSVVDEKRGVRHFGPYYHSVI